MRRFVWDLHFPPPPGLPRTYPIAAIYKDTPSEPLGPFVLPGKYTVKLTVDGKSYVQSLTVKMDPRVKTPAAGLRALTINGGGGFDVALQPHQPDGVDLSLESIERSRADANSALVNTLYALRLGRMPSAAEEAAWMAIMQQQGRAAVRYARTAQI